MLEVNVYIYDYNRWLWYILHYGECVITFVGDIVCLIIN